MKKRFIITTFLMLLFVSVALSTGTYAWFTMSNENKLTDFTISARAASGGLEISGDGQDFSSENLQMTSPSLKAIDTTSPDGIQVFKAKSTSSTTGLPTEYEKTTAGTDYYEFPVYFRTSSAGYIIVDGSKCGIVPVNTATTGDDINVSSFGTFSRDYIAAASRISFQVVGYQNSTSDKYSKTDTNNNVYGTDAYIIEPNNKVSATDSTLLNKIYLSQDENTNAWSISTQDHTDNVYKINKKIWEPGDKLTTTEYNALLATQKTLCIEKTSTKKVQDGYKVKTGFTVNAGEANEHIYAVGDLVTDAVYATLGDNQANCEANMVDTATAYEATTNLYGVPTGLTSELVGSNNWPTDEKTYAIATIGNLGTTASQIGTIGYAGAFTEGSGKVQIIKVMVRVWIEGQDNEAKTALAQGRFQISLAFKFVPATIDATTTIAAPSGVLKLKGTAPSQTYTATWGQVVGAGSYEIFKVKVDSNNKPIMKTVGEGTDAHQEYDVAPVSQGRVTTLYKAELPILENKAGEDRYAYFIQARVNGVDGAADSNDSELKLLSFPTA